jgi:hypothetical protein
MVVPCGRWRAQACRRPGHHQGRIACAARRLHKPAAPGRRVRHAPARRAAGGPRPRRTRWNGARRCTNAAHAPSKGLGPGGPGQHAVGEGQPDLGAEAAAACPPGSRRISALSITGPGNRAKNSACWAKPISSKVTSDVLGGIARQHPRGVPDQVRVHAGLGPIQRETRAACGAACASCRDALTLLAAARRSASATRSGSVSWAAITSAAMGCALPEAASQAA